MRLLHKLLVLTLVPLTLMGAVLVTYGLVFNNRALLEEADTQASLQLDLHSRSIEEFFAQKIGMLQLLASEPETQATPMEAFPPMLRHWQRQLPEFEGIYLIELDGTLHDMAGTTITVVDRDYFPQVRRAEVVVTPPLQSRVTGKPIVLLSVPIFDEESRLTGAICGTLLIQGLIDRVTKVTVGQQGFAALVDGSGRVLSGGTGKFALPDVGRQLADAVGRLAARPHAPPLSLTLAGESCRVSLRAVAHTPWHLVLVHLEREALARVSRSTRVTLMLLGLTGLLAIGLVFGMHALIVRPIQRLAAAHAALAAGRLATRLEARPGNDELEGLARSFNGMAEELERADARLRESEALFRMQFELGNIGIVINDASRQLVRVNDRLCQMLGYSSEELRGITWQELSHPDDLAFSEEQFSRLMRGEIDCYELKKRYLRKDGSVLPVLLNVSCSRDDEGRPRYLIAAILDLTAMSEAEAALREGELRFKTVLEHLEHVAVQIYEPDGTITFWNRGSERTYGYSAEEMVGRNLLDILPQSERQAESSLMLRATQDGDLPEVGEVTLASKNGPPVTVLAHRVLHRRPGREPEFWCFDIDITARREAEEALRESEELFRTIFDLCPLAITIHDLDGRFLAANSHVLTSAALGLEDMWGKTAQELPQMYHPDPECQQAFHAQLRGQGQANNFEMELVNPADGKRMELLLSARMFNYRGQPAMLIVSTDVTDRKRLEAQLLQAQKMEAIGQLAGGVAHDFNNLLQVILGFLELAGGAHVAANQMQVYHTEMRRAAERAASLTQQLLAFGRRQVLHLAPLDLNVTVGEMLGMLRRLISENIEIRTLLADDLPAVNADRSQLDQVLINLCVNARDAMAANGGALTIETAPACFDESFCADHDWAQPGDYVLLSVSDTGVGMDAATLEQIFEPFFTSKPQGEGTGLGLATVYGIVHQHGGIVRVYSEPGHGSRFLIYLPAYAATVVPEKPIRPDTAPEGSGELILVAEDEEQICVLVEAILQDAGYQVLIAADGGQAITLLEQHRDQVRLLLLDVVMPVMGGAELYLRLREIAPDVRCIFASGYSQNSVHHEFINKTGMRFLQKPYGRGELLAAVRLALDAPPPVLPV